MTFPTDMSGWVPPSLRSRYAVTELRGLLGKVVVADRLREVRALEAFHRDVPGRREDLVRVDLTRASNARRVPWLPAVEVHGEGIFVSLDEARLQAWEATSPSLIAWII